MPEEKKIKNVEDVRIMSALSYVWVLFLIPLLAKRDSDLAQFHAKQGFILFLFVTIIGGVSWFPILGWLIGFFGGILSFIFFIIGVVNALSNKKEMLPLIGQYAEKFNL